VKIFDSPATQQFAAYDAGPGTLQVRYDASTKTYEVKADEHQWEALRQGAETYEFGSEGWWLSTSGTPVGYRYTALADWSTPDWGITAFGIPTPQGAVPTMGAATFDGMIRGSSDTMLADQDPWSTTSVSGSITLAFDFAAGKLTGEIHPQMSAPHYDYQTWYSYDLGTYGFSNTIFSVGSTTFSGQFDSKSAGDNAFNGQFTGPHAEELMGQWRLPFLWSDPGAGDNQVHSAWGVFIGKKP
jgi:hypothetical protein